MFFIDDNTSLHCEETRESGEMGLMYEYHFMKQIVKRNSELRDEKNVQKEIKVEKLKSSQGGK